MTAPNALTIDSSLFLSFPTEKDIPALVTHLNDREIYDQTFMLPFPYTEEHAVWFLQFVKEKNASGFPTQWAIYFQNEGLIGAIGFHEPSPWNPQARQVGYWLGKSYRQRGIMTKVLKRICQYGFDELGLVRIEAPIYSGNLASYRVAEKCGFQFEGILRKYICKDQTHRDCALYALVR